MMDKFITASEASKNALNMMMVSSPLPVNILVLGEEGVGKKRLVASAFPDAHAYDARELEMLFRENRVDLSDEKEIVVYDIDRAGNVSQLLLRLEQLPIKIIATAQEEKELFNEKFLVKIDLPPLSKRPEDTAILVQDYIQKAKMLFRIEDDFDVEMIDVDVSQNSISLKESIYRSLLLGSINRTEMMSVLEQFLDKEIVDTTDYKLLLEIFEVPLLKAMRRRYKSQLQMASKLNINRNTLRKKMYQYGLEEK
jgi:DNA-binding NtrC family response regulator